MAKEAASADGKKGGKKKLVMIIIPALVVAGLAAKMTVLKDKAGAKEAEKPVEVLEGEIVDVGSLTVNLADQDRRYARVGIALVLSAAAPTEEVVNRVPLLKDAAITKIGAHTSAELRTIEGQELLRKELAEATEHVWEEGEVLRVALTEILVQ